MCRKATTARGKRALKARQPQIVERTKKVLLMRGHATNGAVHTLLGDFKVLLAPHVHAFTRNNDIKPFEDYTQVERFVEQFSCGMFLLGSHTKKRPLNLVIGRTFDHHMLDMLEVGVSNYAPIVASDMSKWASAKGSKPLLVFRGEGWESDEELQHIRTLLIDLYRGTVVDELDLAGIDHAYFFATAGPGCPIDVRHFAVQMKKSGTRVPITKLVDIGPSFSMLVRRTSWGPKEVRKAALRDAARMRPKKQKNVETNVFGESVGQLHMTPQDLREIALRKVKKLQRTDDESDEEEEEEEEEEV
jgi:ribosome production factor 2